MYKKLEETNNIQISINGKPWKVMPGKGYADSQEERSYLTHMRNWAEKKSTSTGKKWTVSLTGAKPTVNELSTEKLVGACMSSVSANEGEERTKSGRRADEERTKSGLRADEECESNGRRVRE